MNILTRIKTGNCTGCHSCYNCCPVSAISMKSNEEGFLIPLIDEKKCIHCEKCIVSCPVVNAPTVNVSNRYFAAYCKDQEKHKLSASGGLFSIAAEYIIECGGYVVGAAFDSKLHLRHIIINNKKDLEQLVGTKYVQSEIGDVFKTIKKLLNAENIVLFAGTSCQIAGLKSFLGKEYKNLFCMDLICHGVPSPLIWEKYLNELSSSDTIVGMTFRDKSSSNLGWPLIFECKSGNKIVESYQDNKFIKGFIRNYYLRLSCYECNFKGLYRCSDITIGDFWGLERYNKSLWSQYGTSIGITHTKKGIELFDNILDRLEYKEISEKVVKEIENIDNPCLFDSVKLTKKRKLFFKKYKNKGVLLTIDELSKPTLFETKDRILWKIRVRLSHYIKYWR